MKARTPDGRSFSVTRRWMPWRRRVKELGDAGGPDLVPDFLSFADDPVGLVFFAVLGLLTALLALPALLLLLGAALEVALLVALLPVAVLLRALVGVPWEVEVRDMDAGVLWPVVHVERVKGWSASASRIRTLAGHIATRQFVPPVAGALRISRQSVAMGDDATDNTLYADLPRGAVLADLLSWLALRGPFVSAGDRTTWLLREGRRGGEPLAVLELRTSRTEPRTLHTHPVADPTRPLSRDVPLHLDYLLGQDVAATIALVRERPRGPYRLT